jgi:PEGA domain
MSSPRAVWVVVFFLGLGLLGALPSSAEASTGLRVAGDTRFRVVAEQRIAAWLAGHGHEITEQALSEVGFAALDECYLRDEPKCANKYFAENGKSDIFLYASFQVSSTAGSRERSVRGTLWLLRKQGEAAVFDRQCNRCDDDAISAMLDALIEKVGSFSSRVGTLKLTSSPAGATVEIDGDKVGQTPLDHPLPAGRHEIAVLRDGFRVERRTIDIEEGVTSEELVTLASLSSGPSRTRKIAAYTATGAAVILVATGVAALVLHEGEPCAETKKECFVSKPAGFAALAGAGVMAGLAGYLWLTMDGPEPSPSTAIGPPPPRSYSMGWGGRF